MPRDSVSRTANVGTVETNGLMDTKSKFSCIEGINQLYHSFTILKMNVMQTRRYKISIKEVEDSDFLGINRQLDIVWLGASGS